MVEKLGLEHLPEFSKVAQTQGDPESRINSRRV
jgi:hypothetical protein